MTGEPKNVPGHDGIIPTPVCDLIADLLSQGLSGTTAVNAGRTLERRLTENTRVRGTIEDRRQYERERKAAQRARKPTRVPDNVPDKNEGVISSRESNNTQKEREKDRFPKSPVPDNPGQKPERDDWPSDHVERFWQAYPPQRRTEKAKVAKKLALVRKSGKVTFAKLMAALERFANSDDVARGFAKGPVVWLNGGCWDDEVRTVRQQKPKQRQMSALTRIALGLEGEDHDEPANGYDGPTLDLRPVPDSR